MCSSLESLLPVFEFAGARLRGVHGGEVRFEASSMWVGAQAWRRVSARGDRRCLPIPFRRKTQPTAKPPPVIVIGANNVADLGFRRLSSIRGARGGARGDLRPGVQAAVACIRERQPGGGGGPTNTSTMEKKNSRPGVQAAAACIRGGCQFSPTSPRWSPWIYGPGVQAEAICIQDGCRTHPGSLSRSLRGVSRTCR